MSISFKLIAIPIVKERGFVGSVARGRPLVTNQGFHGDMLSFPSGKLSETRFTFYDDEPYDGLLYCDVIASGMSDRERESLLVNIFKNLRWIQ